MLESQFQSKLIKELKKLFPGCIVMKSDSGYLQGIPDLLILFNDKWAALECKQHAGAKTKNIMWARWTRCLFPDLFALRTRRKCCMIFNNHSNLEGQHAFLGASKYHWINYDETKVADAYSKFLATQRGTVLHDFACQCITLGQKLPKSQKTLNMYVNDAISFRMVPEQILFYSENCFGTADTIVFRNGTLRIHDLKTGVVPAHMEQLEIYAALFCLEYKVKPSEIEMELRLYQNNEILYHTPTAEDIVPIMDKIITFDKVIRKIREQEG